MLMLQIIIFQNNFVNALNKNFRDGLISSMNETVSARKSVQAWTLFQDKVDTGLCGDPKNADIQG